MPKENPIEEKKPFCHLKYTDFEDNIKFLGGNTVSIFELSLENYFPVKEKNFLVKSICLMLYFFILDRRVGRVMPSIRAALVLFHCSWERVLVICIFSTWASE